MSISERISPLIGRCVIAWFFLSEAWNRLDNWDATITLMRMQHVWPAQLVLVIAVTVMILGGLSLVTGLQTRHGALILFAFTIAASLMMNDFWTIKNAVARQADYDIFIRNMTIAGGLLLLVGMGPGLFALDNRGGKNR